MRLGDEFECHFKLRVPDVSSFFFTREMEHVSVKATARILHFDLIFNFWFFPFFFFLQSIDTPVIGYWTAELRPS